VHVNSGTTKVGVVALLAFCVALAGCATTAQADEEDSTDALVAYVQDNWTGSDVPPEHWIRAEALFACKRYINARELPTNPSPELALIIEAASSYLC
jgi:hypothetical protein